MSQDLDTDRAQPTKQLISPRDIVVCLIGAMAMAFIGWGSIVYDADHDPRSRPDYHPYENQALRSVPGKWAPDGYFPDCFMPQTRADAELCAQWAAASATEEANRLTRLGIQSNAIQGFLLCLGLFLSAWAAFAAAKAAQAAEESVEEAKRTARKQLRAYVGFEPAPNTDNFILMSDQHLKCWFVIENLGSTPALNTSIDITIAYVSEGKEILLSSRQDTICISLLPNKHRKMSVLSDIQIDDGMKSSILLHWSEIQVSGKVDYDDIYGIPHTTSFSFYARGQENFDEKRLSISPQGNYVT